ncbi:hypothetical protein ACFU6K_03745 [Kitasatospora sp. NPDC057512]|uniref:hypothetical protein n=1 Tax=Kitasatospora sp. NPDC057512 TaxID=3346154 RepID=UPI00368597FD
MTIDLPPEPRLGRTEAEARGLPVPRGGLPPGGVRGTFVHGCSRAPAWSSSRTGASRRSP